MKPTLLEICLICLLCFIGAFCAVLFIAGAL
jgi:hypothetical protein